MHKTGSIQRNALLLEEDHATVTGNMYRTFRRFRQVRTCGFAARRYASAVYAVVVCR